MAQHFVTAKEKNAVKYGKVIFCLKFFCSCHRVNIKCDGDWSCADLLQPEFAAINSGAIESCLSHKILEDLLNILNN